MRNSFEFPRGCGKAKPACLRQAVFVVFKISLEPREILFFKEIYL